MAYVSDGSRICNADRAPLAAIDATVHIFNLDAPIIYCGGVYLGVGDVWEGGAVGGRHTWFWRVLGGSFAQVAATGEIRYGANTDLVDSSGVDNLEKKTLQTATSNSANLAEFEGSNNRLVGLLTGEQSGESQFALSLSGAVRGATYEMMQRCFSAVDGTTDITYPARIIIGHPPAAGVANFPKPVLR